MTEELNKEQKVELINKEVKDLTDDEFETVSDMQGSGEAEKLLKDTEKPDDSGDTPAEKAPDEETIDDDDDDDDDEEESKKKSKKDEEEKDDKEESEDEDKKAKDEDGYKMSLSKHDRKVKKLKKEHKQAIEKMTTDFTGKIDELQAKVMEVSKEQSDTETKKALKKLARESGVDYKTLKGVVAITRKALNIDTSKVDTFNKSQKDAEEKSKFEDDFSENIIDTLEEVNASISNVQLKKAKAFVKKLAYSDKYLNYSLTDIYKLNKSAIDKLVSKPNKSKSAEGSRPNSQRGTETKSKTISEMNTEEMADLSDEEFEKLSNEEAEGQTKNKVMRRGVQVN